MNTKLIFRLAALVLLAGTGSLLTSCSNDDLDAVLPDDHFPEDGVMRFSSSVKDVQTRAFGYDDSNVTENELYLWVTPTGENPSDKYTYKNYILHHTAKAGWGTYSTYEDGSYIPATLLWQDKTTPVEVTASNFRESLTVGEELPTDYSMSIYYFQTDDNSIKDSDCLYFKGTVNPGIKADETGIDGNVITYALTSEGKIRLPMRHLLSKVTISLTLGTEFSATDGLGTQTANPLKDVAVDGVYRTVRFNMKEDKFGEFKNWQGNVVPGSVTLADEKGNTASTNTWTPAKDATEKASATYHCILIPQTVGAGTFSVSFTLGSKKYKWTSTNAVHLDSGYAYTLELTAGKELLTVKNLSATAWGEENRGSLTTE